MAEGGVIRIHRGNRIESLTSPETATTILRKHIARRP